MMSGKREAKRAARGGLTVMEVKTTVRERDGDQCVECGTCAVAHLMKWGRTLEVHRLVPGSPYTVAGCVTLCQECHDDKPRRKPGEVDAETEGFSVRLPYSHRKPLEELAKKLNMTLAAVVQKAMLAYLAECGVDTTGLPSPRALKKPKGAK